MQTMLAHVVVVLGTTSALVVWAAKPPPPARDTQPVIVHAKQPKSLRLDWAHPAMTAAWKAACVDTYPPGWSWRTQTVQPQPESPDGPLPVKMTATIRCTDGSRHAVVVFFDG
jgi:hypothetical protein